MSQEYDFELAPFKVWGIDSDDVCMDMGKNTHEGLDDMQALYAMRRLKFRYQRRLDEINYHIDRLEQLNEPTEHTMKEHNEQMARTERWRREVFPRELEIALHENGIVVNG